MARLRSQKSAFAFIFHLILVVVYFEQICAETPVITKVPGHSILGEGPHWDADQQVLYYVDIFGEVFHKYNPATQNRTTCSLKGASVAFVVPVAGTTNQFIVGHGRKVLKVTWDGVSIKPDQVEELYEIHKTGDEVNNRFNDGKCDPFGRLYAGTMGPEPQLGVVEKGKGAFFRFESASKEPKRLQDNISISNGLGWDLKNNRFYYIDSLEYRVDQFDYDPKTGDLSNRKPMFDFKKNNIPGLPDGLCVDADGKVWVACVTGSQVIRVDPETGTVMQTLQFPAKLVTSVAFGGSNLDVLYVTSADRDPSETGGNAGKLFQVTGLGVKGLPGDSFKL